MLKFTGTIKNLKNIGGEFNKLYANNYKCYRFPLEKGQKYGNSFMVWVGSGGYIEYKDLYDNTENFINALREIKWEDMVESQLSKEKYAHIRLNHGDSSKGFKISHQTFTIESLALVEKRHGEDYTMRQHSDIIMNMEEEIGFDRELTVTKGTTKQILDLYEEIQSC